METRPFEGPRKTRYDSVVQVLQLTATQAPAKKDYGPGPIDSAGSALTALSYIGDFRQQKECKNSPPSTKAGRSKAWLPSRKLSSSELGRLGTRGSAACSNNIEGPRAAQLVLKLCKSIQA